MMATVACRPIFACWLSTRRC